MTQRFVSMCGWAAIAFAAACGRSEMIATVSTAGYVNARLPGQVTVTATSE